MTLGDEVLEGDGKRGFSTPLATLHAHNGFADVFLSTPANGLTDLYLKAAVPLGNTTLTAVYHRFEADRGSARYGDEIDLVAAYPISKQLKLTAKLAAFDGSTMVDVTKFWLQLDMSY